MTYQKINKPLFGAPVTCDPRGQLQVPDQPIITYIAGDGIGVDITPVMLQVVDTAVAAAYQGQRRIAWMEIYAGEKATRVYGPGHWLPDETLDALKQYLLGIKGPLTTPVGGGMRSLNVALRQQLDLFTCLRPVRYFEGVPSPVRHPEKVDMVIFRENSEDIYAGIEWAAGTQEAQQLMHFLRDTLKVTQVRFPNTSGLGIKPVSQEGTERLVARAIQYAIDHHRTSVTLVHKGNIMKHTEGAFRQWGYALAQSQFGAEAVDGTAHLCLKHPHTGAPIIIKDVIADAFLQHILLYPEQYDVIATLNLNGDYISDALAAQVGGIGIAPGANLGETIALFEATHGTAPGYAGLDKANPSGLILSAEMLLRHLGWVEAADLIIGALSKAIRAKTVTDDFARLMTGAKRLTCSEFGAALMHHIKHP